MYHPLAQKWPTTAIALVFVLFAASTKPASGDEAFSAWLEGFKSEALTKGIDRVTIDKAARNIKPIQRVLELDKRQPEFMLTLWRYMEIYVPDRRVERGQELLKKHAKLLNEIEAKYGVPPRFLVAFWGVETDFGRNFGSFNMLSAVATLAFDARRADFFRSQLLSSVRLLQRGDITVDVKSSWAGAMGNMQFIPSTFEAYAVDHDGDGKRDLWGSLPDAFASASNYLRKVGWKPEFTWGREIELPDGFDWSIAGRHVRKPLSEWQSLGVRKTGGGNLPGADIQASVLVPAGADGPAFLVYDNFRTIMRWNTSELYAIAVGHLADRLIGGQRLTVKKPANAKMLKFADISTMQRLLTRLGYDTGGIDGRAGPMTRAAIRSFQIANRLQADGHPSFGLLERLRNAAGG